MLLIYVCIVYIETYNGMKYLKNEPFKVVGLRVALPAVGRLMDWRMAIPVREDTLRPLDAPKTK